MNYSKDAREILDMIQNIRDDRIYQMSLDKNINVYWMLQEAVKWKNDKALDHILTNYENKIYLLDYHDMKIFYKLMSHISFDKQLTYKEMKTIRFCLFCIEKLKYFIDNNLLKKEYLLFKPKEENNNMIVSYVLSGDLDSLKLISCFQLTYEDMLDVHGKNILIIAIYQKNIKMIDYICNQYSFLLDKNCNKGYNVLTTALITNDVNVVIKVLEYFQRLQVVEIVNRRCIINLKKEIIELISSLENFDDFLMINKKGGIKNENLICYY